jgi:hypothetical protein
LKPDRHAVRGRIEDGLHGFPLAHVYAKGISSQGSFDSAGIYSIRPQLARVLVAGRGTVQTDFGVGSQKQILAPALKIEFVMPAPATSRRYVQTQAPGDNDLPQKANSLDIFNVLVAFQADF